MGDQKYQIFISSTFKDLEKERMAVIGGILRLRHFPVGMESFSASSDEQFEYIKKIIDNCDYYVLIIGGCYGSVNKKTNKSYTQMEFEYALSKNIPVIVFPHKNIDDLHKKDEDLENIKRFTELASENRMCKYWTNVENLKSEVVISLLELFEDKPRQGWQKFENKTPLLEKINAFNEEINILKKENQELKEELNKNNAVNSNIKELEAKYLIEYTNRHEIGFMEYRDTKTKIKLTWNEIFEYAAPFLFEPNSYFKFKNLIHKCIGYKTKYDNNIIEDNYIQTIKIKFNDFGLIEIYTQKNPKGLESECIKITDKGRKYLTTLIATKVNNQ